MTSVIRSRTSSLWGKLALLVLLSVVTFGSFLFYLQTHHGFRHVVVPLVATLTGATFEVRDGVLSLQGALEMDGLLYEDNRSGILIEAEQLALLAAPLSFVSGGVPQLHTVELKHADIQLIYQQGPDAESGQDRGGGSRIVFPMLPIAIEQARFDDVDIIIEHADRRMSARVDATLDHLGPGKTGNIAVEAGFLLEPSEGPTLSSEVKLTLSTEIHPDGTPIRWRGTNQMFLRVGRGPLEPTDPDVLLLEQTLDGDQTSGGQALQASSTITMRRDDQQVGTAELRVAMDQTARPAVTDVSLTMADITADLMNLWLGNTAREGVVAGQFDAQMVARLEGTAIFLRSDITGSGVRLHLEDNDATPPVDFSFQQDGSFDSERLDVAINSLVLTLRNGGRTLVSGALSRPVVLHLDPSDSPERSTPTTNLEAKPAIWLVKLPEVEVKELRPWLTLLGHAPLAAVATGTLRGELAVTMHGEGAIIETTGHLEGQGIRFRDQGEAQQALTAPVKIVTEGKSRLTNWQLLDLKEWTTSVSVNETQVATVRGAGVWRLAEEVALTSLHGDIELTGLRGEMVNPWLALWSPVRIERARLDGHARVTMDEARAQWAVKMDGQEMQLRLIDAKSPAPPLNLSLKQTGGFDRRTRTLQLNELHVQALEGRRSVAAVSLDQPLSVSLSPKEAGNDTTTGGAEEPITVALRIDNLGIRQLRPWGALAGSQTIERIRKGALNADLKIRLKGIDDVSVMGGLDLDQVAIKRDNEPLSAPVTFDTDIRARIIERSRVTVDSWVFRALDRTNLLAQAQLSGFADSRGKTDLDLKISAGNVSDVVGRLGLLNHRQRNLVAGGALEGNVRLTTPGPQNPLTVTADLRSEDLTIQLDPTRRDTHAIGLKTKVEVNGPRTAAEIQQVTATLKTGGIRSGALTARGRWLLTSTDKNASGGTVTVQFTEWESGPLVDFLGLMPGRQVGPLPIAGQVIVTQQSGSHSLTVRGNETIGPITVRDKGGDHVPATVHLEHHVTKIGGEYRMRALALTVQRPGRRADHVTVRGHIRTGSKPRMQVRGNLEALDADWYSALLSSLPVGAEAAVKPANSRKVPGVAVPAHLDVDLAIGSVTYNSLELRNGRLLAKGNGTNIRTRLEPSDVAGGSVQGLLTIVPTAGQLEYAWEAKGDALDVGVLMGALSAEQAPRLAGQGGFTTSGIGHGSGEMLRQSLDGTLTLDVADGHFVKSTLLEFLAEQTHIDEFRGLGFTTLRGDLRIKEGWVHLEPVRVKGPSVALEARGRVALDGQLDVLVHPKIGPDLSDDVQIPCLDQFAETADGFTVLPVAVAVKGTTEHPVYRAKIAPGGMVSRQVGAVVGTIADLLTACQGGEVVQEATEKALEAITGTVKKGVGIVTKPAKSAIGTVTGTAKEAAGALVDSTGDLMEDMLDEDDEP